METRVSLCQSQIPPSSFLFAVPHDLDTSWSLPDCTVSTSVPEVSLASVAFPEPHPLDRVRQGGDLQLSSRRGWAAAGGPPSDSSAKPTSHFFPWGKVRKKPCKSLIHSTLRRTLSWEKETKASTKRTVSDLLSTGRW